MENHFLIRDIGVIHSEYIDPNDMRQHIKFETDGLSTIEIYTKYQKGLLNLSKYHNSILVIYWMHKINEGNREVLTRFPFNNKDKYPEMGIFACGSAIRTNPIGITPCEIIKINKNIITVKGLDALNESPVIDIKPYCSCNYIIEGSKYPEWVHKHHQFNVKDVIK